MLQLKVVLSLLNFIELIIIIIQVSNIAIQLIKVIISLQNNKIIDKIVNIYFSHYLKIIMKLTKAH